MIFDNPVQLLADLVKALQETNWSSWQTTAGFDTELRKAEEYLERLK